MEGLCEEVYRIRQKEYIYRRDGEGRLMTEMGSQRLEDRDVGSAINTFRKNQLLNSKFTADFWN